MGFNITGIVIFYPIPFMRNIPISGARALGKATRLWRGFPVVYILVLFILLPLMLFGITTLFNNGSLAFTVLGAMLIGILVIGIAYYIFWFKFRGGAAKCNDCFERRQAKQAAMRNLADDLDYMKARIAALADHTGLPDDAVEEGETEALVKVAKDDGMQETARPPAAAPIYTQGE